MTIVAAPTKPLRELAEIPHWEFALITGAEMTSCTGTMRVLEAGPMCDLACEECGYQQGAQAGALRRALERHQPREEEDLPWYQRY